MEDESEQQDTIAGALAGGEEDVDATSLMRPDVPAVPEQHLENPRENDAAVLRATDSKRKRGMDVVNEHSFQDLKSPNRGERLHVSQGSSQSGQWPGKKRAKLDLHEHARSSRSPTHASEPPKLYGLPLSIWQKIFSLLPPIFLGRLLRVSKAFNSLLSTGPSVRDGDPPGNSPSQLIWLASRRRFAPGLPKALPGQDELQMWRLIRGNTCQICKSRKRLITMNGNEGAWRCSSDDSLRVVWPFQIRCCVSCLQSIVEHESSLLFSSSLPSLLLPILPYVFLTDGKHYVHSLTVKSSASPESVQLSKAYHKDRVRDIQERFDAAKAADSEYARRWVEQLKNEANVFTQGILDWEQWEVKGGLKKVNSRPSTRAAPVENLTARKHSQPPPESALEASKRGSQPVENAANTASISIVPDSDGILAFTPTPTQHPFAQNPAFLTGGLPPRPSAYASTQRPERNLKDVTEAKALRRAEIEKRCLELDPPIPANVLSHMDSFQAALQIPQQLTEKAWEMLKPRLLDQREAAFQEESERIAKTKGNSEANSGSLAAVTQTQDPKDAIDREWDASQSPIRDRLSLYADERIQNRWAHGAAVTQENCPVFAADILLHVKRRFDESQLNEKNNGPADVTHGNVLILENMKWVFDNKIRPISEMYLKEIFLCSTCEGNSKHYGFEAVIQHYAAKHTNSLSQGSVIVHWRAKWPDQPPFHPNPGVLNPSYAFSGPGGYNSGTPSTLSSEIPNPIQNTPVFDHPPFWTGSNTPSGVMIPRPPLATNYTLQPRFMAGHYPVAPQTQSTAPTIPYSFPNTADPYVSAPIHSHSGGSWTPQASGTISASQGTMLGPPAYPNQLNDMAKHAREVWFAIAGVKDMPSSLRIFVVIQHVAARFASTHSYEPTAAMFLDGLNHNPLMRPVRSLNGLACKKCSTVNISTSSTNDSGVPQSTREKRLYTLPHLLNHFKSAHLENAQFAAETTLNWKDNLVELPDNSTILDLINAPGMDDGKLALIAQVLPGMFPTPLPTPGSYRFHPLAAQQEHQLATCSKNQTPGTGTQLSTSFPRGQSHERFSPAISNSSESRKRRSPSGFHESERAGEDEYDPHRPAYLGKYFDSRKVFSPENLGADASHYANSPSSTYPQSAPIMDIRVNRREAVYEGDAIGRETQTRRNNYDPNEPIIKYEPQHRDSHPRPEPPKIEVIEADRFLDNLEPGLEKGHVQQPVSSRYPEIRYKDGTYSQQTERYTSVQRAYSDHVNNTSLGSPSAQEARYEPPRQEDRERQVKLHYANHPSISQHPPLISHEQPKAGGFHYVEHPPYTGANRARHENHESERNNAASRSQEPGMSGSVHYTSDEPYVTPQFESGYAARSPVHHVPTEHPSSYGRLVHPLELPHGSVGIEGGGSRGQRMEYIPVEEYHRTHRPAPSNALAPPDTREYVLEDQGAPSRRALDAYPYEVTEFASLASRADATDRVIYREYR